MNVVKPLFDRMMNLDASALHVPSDIEQEFIIHPEIVLPCVDYFSELSDDGFIKNKEHQLFLLLNEGFTRLRYKLDNQDYNAQSILDRLHQKLKQIFQTLSMEKKMLISNALHEAKLPTPELDYDDNVYNSTVLDQLPDIAPQLPAFLDLMRREGGISTSFELYAFLIAQIQMQPIDVQCSVINELITAKNTFVQDVGVLMLLHPKKSIRCIVPLIWLHNFTGNTTQISPVSLRRFIVIRNWLPQDEQTPIDTLIQQVRKKGIMPAPHPSSKITKLISSCVDGAGVQCILFETKAKNQRTIAGFLLKDGIGIREPFVMHKAQANEFSDMIAEYTLPSKSVSITFVSKFVGHFISVGQRSNHIPEPSFLEVSELFGAQNWLPQPINPLAEINRIKEQEKLDTGDSNLVEQALTASSLWTIKEDFANSWFETGDRTNKALTEAVEEHSKLKKKHQDNSLPKITTRLFMKDELFDKWVFILIRMLLWHRSKSIKRGQWKYFLVIAELLLQGHPVENIPLMEQITERSVAYAVRQQMFY